LHIEPKTGYSRHWADFHVPGIGNKLEAPRGIDTSTFGESAFDEMLSGSFSAMGVTPFQRAKDTARALQVIEGVEGVWYSTLDGTLKVKADPQAHEQVSQLAQRAGMTVQLVDHVEPNWRSLTYRPLEEWSSTPDFTTEDIQLFFDMQIAAGQNLRGALQRTRTKFSIDSLQCSPVGVVSSPNIAIPSAAEQQAQAQAEQQEKQMEQQLQQMKAEAKIQASVKKK
jgi:hypothetical protein